MTEAMRIEAPYTVPQFVGVSPDLNHQLSERAGNNGLFPAEALLDLSPYSDTPMCILILITLFRDNLKEINNLINSEAGAIFMSKTLFYLMF